MLTIKSTATVDEGHRLTLAVPASVPPGAHSVVVVIHDAQEAGTGDRGVMRTIPDFVAQQRAAGMEMFTRDEAEAFDQWLAGESVLKGSSS